MGKKVLVVDDEKLARDRIIRFIDELGYDFQIYEADSGASALDRIVSNPPDLLFLDIQMPGLTGLELLQNLENRPFSIIFQAAYDEYAIKAFEENASDYLLKPFSKDRFKIAVEKCLNAIQHEQRLAELEETFRKCDGYLNRISVRQGTKLHLIEASEIQYFLSQDHYTCLFTNKSDFITELSLKNLEERLEPSMFLRCHRNNIVNIEKVLKIGTGPNMTVTMECGAELPVSRQNRQVLLNRTCRKLDANR